MACAQMLGAICTTQSRCRGSRGASVGPGLPSRLHATGGRGASKEADLPVERPHLDHPPVAAVKTSAKSDLTPTRSRGFVCTSLWNSAFSEKHVERLLTARTNAEHHRSCTSVGRRRAEVPSDPGFGLGGGSPPTPAIDLQKKAADAAPPAAPLVPPALTSHARPMRNVSSKSTFRDLWE